MHQDNSFHSNLFDSLHYFGPRQEMHDVEHERLTEAR